MNRQRIGFIGLGNIGRPMAVNLIGDHADLCVHDADPKALDALQSRGAQPLTPTAMAEQCSVICLCVRDDRDVEQLLYGASGLLETAQAGTLIAIHSTITLPAFQGWLADARRHRIELIDAPVTGGAHGAEARELVYMVGAEAALLERCRPVFESSAKEIVHAGARGAGIALKLSLNLMTFASFIAIKEATALAEGAGLDPEVLYKVGRSNGVVGDFNHRFISNRSAVFDHCDAETARTLFEPFGRLGEKDLDAALQSAQALGLDLPATRYHQTLILKTFIDP